MPSWLYFSRSTNLSFHNLCLHSTNLITPTIRSLLGLGLNFCLRPRYTSTPKTIDFDRFRRDANIKMFFAGTADLPVTKLYKSSKWTPQIDYIPIEYRTRINSFIIDLSRHYHKKSTPINLLPSQSIVLSNLIINKSLHIWKSDKNLGP